MPWNDKNNGGPWGSRGKGPNQPPNVEDIFKKGHEKLKKMTSGTSGGGFNILALFLVVILAVFGYMSVYTVHQGELGTKLLFGKFVGTTPPGLHAWWPSPVGDVIIVKVSQINRVDSGVKVKSALALSGDDAESMMLTGDENIVTVNFTVLWTIKKVEDYLFNDPDTNSSYNSNTVKLAAESAVREIIAQSPIAFVLTKGRGEIADNAQKLLQKMLDDYRVGIQIQEVRLQRVDPPAQVIDAFRDVQRARADKESTINEARAYSNSVIPEARGTATKTIQEAEGYKKAMVADAEGQAQRFLSIYEQYRLAPEIMRKRMYIDTMKQLLMGVNKVIVDGKNQGILPYLPLETLKTKTENTEKSTGASSSDASSFLTREVK